MRVAVASFEVVSIHSCRITQVRIEDSFLDSEAGSLQLVLTYCSYYYFYSVSYSNQDLNFPSSPALETRLLVSKPLSTVKCVSSAPLAIPFGGSFRVEAVTR